MPATPVYTEIDGQRLKLTNLEKVPDTATMEEADKAQLALAKQLAESLTTTFDQIDFEDRYRDALLDLVEKKVHGKQIVNMEENEEDKPVVDIVVALKRSIEAAKKKSA